MWHQPCNNQTALEVHHLVDIQKEVWKASHLITVANDCSAMGQQRAVLYSCQCEALRAHPEMLSTTIFFNPAGSDCIHVAITKS